MSNSSYDPGQGTWKSFEPAMPEHPRRSIEQLESRSDDMADIEGLVTIDLEDAQAIAYNIEERLEYDTNVDRGFWNPILTRLTIAIRHCSE